MTSISHQRKKVESGNRNDGIGLAMIIIMIIKNCLIELGGLLYDTVSDLGKL